MVQQRLPSPVDGETVSASSRAAEHVLDLKPPTPAIPGCLQNPQTLPFAWLHAFDK